MLLIVWKSPILAVWKGLLLSLNVEQKVTHCRSSGIQYPFMQSKWGLVGFLLNIISGTTQKKEDCVNLTQMGSYDFSDKQERQLFVLHLTKLNSSRLLTLVTFIAVSISSACTQAQILFAMFFLLCFTETNRKLIEELFAKEDKTKHG